MCSAKEWQRVNHATGLLTSGPGPATLPLIPVTCCNRADFFFLLEEASEQTSRP